MSLSLSEAKQLKGQVGGLSVHKKPLLSLKPDYVLKPLRTDHRGIREIAFYEALHLSTRSPSSSVYAQLHAGKETQSSDSPIMKVIDTLAVALGMLVQDRVVIASEESMRNAWKQVKREIEALQKLSSFTPKYYGVAGQKRIDPSLSPFFVSDDAHLLLGDLTTNFSKPCVMDLKIGTPIYEPDATVEKRTKEFNKYPQQAVFGIRIVGMRYYEPTDPMADSNGFVFLGKEFGRSLTTTEDISDAMRTFFSCNNGLEHSEQTKERNQKLRQKTVSALVQKLRSLRRWFDDHDGMLTFYSSSLFVLFEGENSLPEKPVGNNRTNDVDFGDRGVVSLNMIDFGHVRRKGIDRETAEDDGYRFGLKTFNDILTGLQG